MLLSRQEQRKRGEQKDKDEDADDDDVVDDDDEGATSLLRSVCACAWNRTDDGSRQSQSFFFLSSSSREWVPCVHNRALAPPVDEEVKKLGATAAHSETTTTRMTATESVREEKSTSERKWSQAELARLQCAQQVLLHIKAVKRLC